MAKWTMVIDLDRCTGCGACMASCKMENNVPIVTPGEAQNERVMNWMDMITEYEGDYPNLEVKHMPKPCFHCDNPPCTRVCPVGAPSGIGGHRGRDLATRAACGVHGGHVGLSHRRAPPSDR